jgi:hypothetical protein
MGNVQDGLSDVPSAPPIHDYSQEPSPALHCDTRTSANASVSEGSTVKKEEHGDGIVGANLPEKTDR